MTDIFEKRVLTYGAFDVFNRDHVKLLRHIAQLGDRVIVGLARNATPPAHFEDQRGLLEASRYVDRVIPLDHPDQARTDIVNHNVAILVVGASSRGRFDHLQDLVQVVYLPNGPDIPQHDTSPERFFAAG